MKTPGFLKDGDGKDSSGRIIAFGLAVVAQIFLFAALFGTDVTMLEIGSMYGTIMGFSWTFKTQGKMGENRELRIKGENYNASISTENKKPAA